MVFARVRVIAGTINIAAHHADSLIDARVRTSISLVVFSTARIQIISGTVWDTFVSSNTVYPVVSATALIGIRIITGAAWNATALSVVIKIGIVVFSTSRVCIVRGVRSVPGIFCRVSGTTRVWVILIVPRVRAAVALTVFATARIRIISGAVWDTFVPSIIVHPVVFATARVDLFGVEFVVNIGRSTARLLSASG